MKALFSTYSCASLKMVTEIEVYSETSVSLPRYPYSSEWSNPRGRTGGNLSPGFVLAMDPTADVDQRQREIQREYLDFLDDGVSLVCCRFFYAYNSFIPTGSLPWEPFFRTLRCTGLESWSYETEKILEIHYEWFQGKNTHFIYIKEMKVIHSHYTPSLV